MNTKPSAIWAMTAALWAGAASAENTLPLLDKASFSLSLALPNVSATVRADGVSSEGTPLNVERDLGLNGRNLVASMGATWRPWQNHEFSFTYFGDDNQATRQLSRDIVFEGVTYAVDSTVESKLSLSTYDVSYTWWGINNESWALGPRVGIVYYRLDAGLEMTLDANGEPVINDAVKATINPDIPAPSLGASWRWRPADDWRVRLDAGYLNTRIDAFDGSIQYINGGVEWLPWTHWGFSLNLLRQSIRVQGDQSDFTGDLDLTQTNASLGVIYRF
jgi:hypothetical protein